MPPQLPPSDCGVGPPHNSPSSVFNMKFSWRVLDGLLEEAMGVNSPVSFPKGNRKSFKLTELSRVQGSGSVP